MSASAERTVMAGRPSRPEESLAAHPEKFITPPRAPKLPDTCRTSPQVVEQLARKSRESDRPRFDKQWLFWETAWLNWSSQTRCWSRRPRCWSSRPRCWSSLAKMLAKFGQSWPNHGDDAIRRDVGNHLRSQSRSWTNRISSKSELWAPFPRPNFGLSSVLLLPPLLFGQM